MITPLKKRVHFAIIAFYLWEQGDVLSDKDLDVALRGIYSKHVTPAQLEQLDVIEEHYDREIEQEKEWD